MRAMVVQIIAVLHNWWLDYYYLVGEIDIYNTDAKGRKTKNFNYLRYHCLSHIGNKTWKKFHIDGFSSHLIFELIESCKTFPKDD
jgi:hypothetical protein